MLVLGVGLIGCSNPTETEEKYSPIAPMADYSTLSELIAAEGGAFFQGGTRSLRFFEDGGFQVFSIGLSSALQSANTHGSRYIIDENTIKIYRATDADAAPFYTMTYTLEQSTLLITGKTNGAGNAPTNTQIPVYDSANPSNVGKYSYGILPVYRP
jgi:hypothetical protein